MFRNLYCNNLSHISFVISHAIPNGVYINVQQFEMSVNPGLKEKWGFKMSERWQAGLCRIAPHPPSHYKNNQNDPFAISVVFQFKVILLLMAPLFVTPRCCFWIRRPIKCFVHIFEYPNLLFSLFLHFYLSAFLCTAYSCLFIHH